MGSSIHALREQVNKLKGETAGRSLPVGCKTRAQWFARLAKHRSNPRGDHGPLFAEGDQDVFRTLLERSDRAIASRMAELTARDWTRPQQPQAQQAPQRPVVEIVQRPEPAAPPQAKDRLAGFRGPVEEAAPMPEAEG